MGDAEQDVLLLQQVYRWIDQIPMSRPKRNISRDFSDGVLMSEVCAHFFPRMVELHNYTKTNAASQKKVNWNTLNKKVLKKFGIKISDRDIDAVINCQKGSIERVLLQVQGAIANYQNGGGGGGSSSMPPVQKSVKSKKIRAGASGAGRGGSNSRNAGSRDDYRGSGGASKAQSPQPYVDSGGIGEKDGIISDLRETVEILQLKVQKLEQLLRLKNAKIDTLQRKLEAGYSGGY